jgi:hypothetical protein
VLEKVLRISTLLLLWKTYRIPIPVLFPADHKLHFSGQSAETFYLIEYKTDTRHPVV